MKIHTIGRLEWQSGRTTSLTFGASGYVDSVWTPDGQSVIFDAADGSPYSAKADGSGQPQVLLKGEATAPRIPSSFSPDGKRLAFVQRVARSGDGGAQREGRRPVWRTSPCVAGEFGSSIDHYVGRLPPYPPSDVVGASSYSIGQALVIPKALAGPSNLIAFLRESTRRSPWTIGRSGGFDR